MKIKIDIREKEIIKLLNCEEKYIIEQLDLGDIIYYDDNDVPLCIIERKTVKDYAASIRDGRYRDQTKRLLDYRKTVEGLKVIILIEGDIPEDNDKCINKVSMKTIKSAILNKIFRDNVFILNTRTVEDTVHYIKVIEDKIIAYSVGNNTEPPENTKLKRSSNMTPELCFVHQLSQIPGVSLKIARSIADKYKNMNELVTNYNDVDKQPLFLSAIPLIGGKRKVGKVVSNRIYEYLIQN